jgi:hypothetical protein
VSYRRQSRKCNHQFLFRQRVLGAHRSGASQNANQEVCSNLADGLGVAVLRTLMRKSKALVPVEALSGKWMCLTFVNKKETKKEAIFTHPLQGGWETSRRGLQQRVRWRIHVSLSLPETWSFTMHHPDAPHGVLEQGSVVGHPHCG